MFRLIRTILGWFIILLGYVAVYTAIAVLLGWEYDPGVSVVGYYLIGDLFLIVGTWVAGGKPYKRKPTFTSPIMAIITWIIILVLYPFMHLCVQVIALLKAFFRLLFGKKSRPRTRPVKQESQDTRASAGDSKVHNAVGSLCRHFSGSEQIGMATNVNYHVSPRYFSHEITLEVQQNFTVDKSRFSSDYEVQTEKNAIERFQNDFSGRIKTLQQDIINQIETLRQQYDSFDDEWVVRVNVNSDTREV